MAAREGRPFLGSLLGAVSGIGASVLLQQAGVWPADRLALFGIPGLLALLGVLCTTRGSVWEGGAGDWSGWILAAVLVIGALTGVPALFDDAGFIDGGCTATGVSPLDETVVTDTSRGDPFVVDARGPVEYTATSPGAITNHTWSVYLTVGGFPVTILDDGDDNVDEDQETEGVEQVADFSDEIAEVLNGDPTGIFRVGAEISGDGPACTGEAWVRFPGSALQGLVGQVAAGVFLLALAALAAVCVTRPTLDEH